MKRTILLIAALISLAASANANPVSTATARDVAIHFWNTYRPAETNRADKVSEITFDELSHLHIFDVDGTGFVIVAGDDCVAPVLAYSFRNLFPSELNPELGYWVRGYESQIATAVKLGAQSSDKVAAQWHQMLYTDVPETPKSLVNVPAMLTTEWNQSAPYNHFCPVDTVLGGRAVVGCVATAMAQIMKYWNFPSFGEGSHTYQPVSWWGTPHYPTLTADFGHTTYLWQYMPDRAENFSPQHQRDAVATLSFHCGVAVEMMYGLSEQGGSAAYSGCGHWTSHCASNAFWQYFKYDTSLFYAERDAYNDSIWLGFIDEQLAQGRPIYYDGSDHSGGHAFVLDGSDNQNRYHFNMGWAGYGDGFYSINNIAPGSGGTGGNATYTFNDDQGAIFGIRPSFVEVFDTVDYFDSICSDSQYIDFHEYHLHVATMDTLLRHLDTIFNYHLKIIGQKNIMLDPNIPGKDPKMVKYCPATGYTFPECEDTRDGHMFMGWCHSPLGEDTIYQPGQHINLNVNRSFTALWLDTTFYAGIGEVDEEAIKLWPNPTTEELSVSLPFHTATLTVLDALGRTILREDYPNVMGGMAKIDLSNLPAGLYTLLIRTDHGTYNRQIIKL